MQVLREVLGNAATTPIDGLQVDLLEIEWFESTKRVQRRKSNEGTEIAIKLTGEGQRLRQNDIVYTDDRKVVLIHIRPCEAIVLTPATLLEMGTVCYEIGNKHLPLFIQNDQVLMPFEDPMYRWLEASGYRPQKQMHQLLEVLKSNVSPHGHGNPDGSLFNRIVKLAGSVSRD